MSKENKETMVSKPSVVVRKRLLADGLYSLYLDINTKGERTRENLQLYLMPGNSKSVKESNEKTIEEAKAIAQQRKEEILNRKDDAPLPYASETYFLNYFKDKAIEKKGEDQSKWGNYRSVLKILETYCNEDMPFTKIDKKWIIDFGKYLNDVVPYLHKTISRKERTQGEKLSYSSKITYFSIFQRVLVEAYRDRLLAENPFVGEQAIIMFPRSQYKRKLRFLTWEEIGKLYDTSCGWPELRRAFLFSCYTGVKYPDVLRMLWKNVNVDEYGQITIILDVPMSKEPYIINVPKQAEEFMGARAEPDDHVFEGLKYNATVSAHLRKWAMSAGILEDFTFSAARHSYIAFLLQSGLKPLEVVDIIGFKYKDNIDIYVEQLNITSND